MTQLHIGEERLAAAIDAFRMVERQANETIVLDFTRDGHGNEGHVIRDTIAGVVLWELPTDIARLTINVAEAKLDELRRRRVVQAIVAVALMA